MLTDEVGIKEMEQRERSDEKGGRKIVKVFLHIMKKGKVPPFRNDEIIVSARWGL